MGFLSKTQDRLRKFGIGGEIPYIVMPFIKPVSNPIMNMQNEMKWIETIQGILGMLSMIFLMLLVRDDVKLFSIATTKEQVFFAFTVYFLDYGNAIIY